MSLERQRFLALAFASADLLVETDDTGRITLAVGATKGLTTFTDVTLRGRLVSELVSPGDLQLMSSMIRSLEPGRRRGPLMIRMAMPGSDGAQVAALVSACRFPDLRDRVAIAFSRANIPAVLAGVGRLRDPTTQALDAVAFQDQAVEVMKAAESVGKRVDLMLIDMPDLDNIYRQLSPEQSEELNRRLGTLLRSVAVDGQTVGKLGDTRYGVVRDAALDANHVTRQLGDLPGQIKPGVKPVTVSKTDMELRSAGLGSEDGVRALRYAVNRFANMKPGERPPQSLSDALQDLVQDTMKRIKTLDVIIEENQFHLVFQPVVSLATGLTHHYEVLARFEQGRGPAELIQFAEEIGVIERLDLAVATKAIQKLRTAPKDVILAVNISGKSIQNSLFVHFFINLLDANTDIASRLEIELTESAELLRLDEVNGIIQQLRKRGFRVCLDDFGAGSASFQYLHALHVDVVKIDGSYVSRIGKSKRDEVMLAGIVRMCAELGVDTIAEYVETPGQAEYLRKIGVGFGQGWLYGKPTDVIGHQREASRVRTSSPLLRGQGRS